MSKSVAFQPYDISILGVLAIYLPYEAFGELKSSSKLLKEELDKYELNQNLWYRRIEEEFRISIPDYIYAVTDLKVLYKILYELSLVEERVRQDKDFLLEDVERRLSKIKIAEEYILEETKMINKIVDYLIHSKSYSTGTLRWAIEHSCKHFTKFLLRDDQVSDVEKNEMFQFVCNSARIDAIKLFLSVNEIDPSYDNNLALRNAFSKGYSKVVELLLSDPKVRNTYNSRQLSIAISHMKKTGKWIMYRQFWQRVFSQHGLSLE